MLPGALFVLKARVESFHIFTFLNTFYLQGLDVIIAILDLNFSEVLTMMDVSPASATSMAQ